MSRLATLLIIALGAANLYLALRKPRTITTTTTIHTPTGGVQGVSGVITKDEFNRIFAQQLARHSWHGDPRRTAYYT